MERSVPVYDHGTVYDHMITDHVYVIVHASAWEGRNAQRQQYY